MTERDIGGIAPDRLRRIIERIERLEEERGHLSNDIKDIYIEAKSAGFDPKVIRQIIQLRKKDPADAEEQEMLFDTYRRALGM
ncbi:MAG: DUF2312 domain-containing protein [Commensalibacter sp.]